MRIVVSSTPLWKEVTSQQRSLQTFFN